MYLDHRVTAKITRILEQIDMSALLMDGNGTVVLPEGDNRQLSLPDQLRRDPTTPMVYGGVTLIGTDDRQPLFICLHGDSQEVKNCAILCAELINMLVHVDLGHATREQAVRLMLRGDRDWIRTLTCQNALNLLRAAVPPASSLRLELDAPKPHE